MAQELEKVERDWDILPNEPEIWYRIFKTYYLGVGKGRSLRSAFELYLRNESPEDYADVDPSAFKNIPSHWSEYSRKFEWARRAAAYDEEAVPDIAGMQVQMVLDYLRASSMKAAATLVRALENPRTAVQASNGILNRIGVPEVSEVITRSTIEVTSDDMAEAAKKIESWKQTSQSG